MPWTLTDDVDLYSERVWSLLARDPVLHTLPLTVIEALRTGYRSSAQPIVLGWFTAANVPADGPADVPADVARAWPVTGAACMTPPYDLLVPEVPAGAMAGLVDALGAASVAVPGVRGQASQVADFSARWCAGPARAGTAIVATRGERQRLYSLGRLTPPGDVAGRARLAAIDDVELATEFWDAFQIEAGVHRSDAGPIARARVDAGLVWLWEVNGTVVSMAGRNPIAAAVARIGPVYTPLEHRRRGYAAAVTSACSQSALDCGARDVALFTDLDNPTSNSVYQSIGYRSVSDFQTIRFA